MELKFLQMLDNLVFHTSTKFSGIWICTLGDMIISLKGTKSVRKVTNVGLIKSHFDWKVLKLETCLQVFEVPKFGFEMVFNHDKKRVQVRLADTFKF